MFSFHKPKVYRSTQGCCICKAKSSSSRFTDSKKYEDDFIDCFQLSTPRRGEICNACVLLVKRFKRLPPGSARHWSHVVDARIGPGIKSMTKFKKRKEEQLMQKQNGDETTSNGNCSNGASERFGKIFKKTKKKKAMEKITKKKISSDPIPGSSDENSPPSSPMSNNSDGTDDVPMTESKSNSTDREMMSGNTPEEIFNSLKCYEGTFYGNNNMDSEDKLRRLSRKSYFPKKNRNNRSINQAYSVDSEFWVQVKVCCGHVYENRMIGALLIDTTKLSQNNCPKHKQENIVFQPVKPIEQPTQTAPTAAVAPPAISVSVMQTVPLKKYQHFTKRNPNGFDFSYDTSANVKTDLVHTVANDTPKISVTLNNTEIEQTSAIDYSTNTNKQTTGAVKGKQKCANVPDTVGSKPHNYLHKIKSDSGRIMKNSIDRLTPSKLKPDLNVVRNLVRLCTDRTAINKKLNAMTKNGTNGKANEKTDDVHNENENNCNKIIEALAGNKFSDNSSDSGYDETLHDTAQLNQIAKVGSTGPVILSNGVKIHVQPQNLLYAANLAGVSQTAIETTQASLKASLLNQQTHLEQQLPFGTNITPISATGIPLIASVQNHIHQTVMNTAASAVNQNEQILYSAIKQKVLPLAPVVNNN